MALAPSSRADNRGNLPGALSPIIGRKREIAEVGRLLSEYRLLTLTGPGGCGKTRLALQIAEELQSEYSDGVWLVEFAALTDEALVPQALASILGVHEQPGRPLVESLASYLRSRETLLLFDNCEHLLDACAGLGAALLVSCPGVRLLATSLEPLAVPGEGVWIVPPLSLPSPQPWRGPASAPEALAAYRRSEAVELFVVRARAAAPDFELTIENGPWVAEICRRLDGIPLAIELAAARTRAYSVRQIADHLDDRFQLLTSRTRTVPQRHQTLEATLDWSYDLLSAKEQIFLRRLAVFVGGWTLDSAGAVCAGDDIPTTETMELLFNLVNKSLVVAARSPDDRRYHFLETVRQHAFNKLTTTGEADAMRDRHLEYFVQWAEASAPHFDGPQQSRWVAKFDVEHDNLRAALDWSETRPGKEEQGLRLAAACGNFWKLRGYPTEGRERLTAALQLAGTEMRTGARAWALIWACNLAYLQSDYSAAASLATEALGIYRELGPAGQSGVALALDWLGEVATEVGDYENAIRLFEEALLIYRGFQDKRGTADMIMQLGWAAMRMGEFERAEAFLNESLPLVQDLGGSFMLGLNYSGLGELAVRRGRYDRASDLLEKSLAIRRELGDQWGIATSLGSLGWVALLRGDFDLTRDNMRESLAIRTELGDQGGISWCLEKLAKATVIQAQSLPPARHQQALLRTARVCGAAANLRAPLNSVIDPADQPSYDRMLADMRRAMGSEAFELAWEEGQAMPLPDIIDIALQPVVSPSALAPLPGARTAEMKQGGLTPRERETACLIAQGKSNREIAAAMTVGVKTVETYVTRIMNKLGVDSRVQIAVWTIENGLVVKKE